MKETYQGPINEFVDWSSGESSLTGNVIAGVDKDHPISGKSIRNLLQSKLKTPFITEKYDDLGIVGFFSSEKAKDTWESYAKGDSLTYDPEKAKEYILYSMDLPATHKITGLSGFSTRYIIEGNSASQNAILQYTLGLEDSLGSPDSDVISVTYTIKDSSGNITYNEGYQIDTDQPVTKNIYLYLRSGDNEISIKAVANNHNAQSTQTFHIYLVTFSISSNFNGYYGGVSNGRPFAFDVAIKRSITNLPVTTSVYVSENDTMSLTPVITWRYTDSGSTPSRRLEIPNSYLASDYEHPRKYRMIIKASMNDAESHSTFESNVLIYEFEVASNLGDLTNSFINCAYSVADSNYTYTSAGKPILHTTQYIPFTFDWGYYTDAGEQQADVEWCLRTGQEGDYTYYDLVSILGTKGSKPTSLSFVPNTPMQYETDNSFLVAKINGEVVEEFPINIEENQVDVPEADNYSLKLSAFGKTNTSDTKDQWTDTEHNVTTTFSSGVSFDTSNGWDNANNSLILKGQDSYATVNYIPFPEVLDGYSLSDNGAAFEIDFKPEQVNSDDDIILTIGDTTKGYIAIRPTSAAFYENSSTPTIKTNFKAGERIKLCFVFNPYSNISNDSNLIYIINNGILERAAIKGNASINSQAGRIKIGGSKSGIRVYSIRCYRQSITPKQALENYMFDNIENSALISRNDIYGDSSSITYQGVQGKQDIIIIEGDLSNILNNAQSKLNATVNITRESNTDASKNFTVTGCRIRNHGQSTLTYPITSMKLWLNKSNSFYEDQSGKLKERVPEFVCSSQQYMNLNKNRYVMKNGSIPANKFVLLANYADSSGAHNGSLLRLIQDTWYNAQIENENGVKEFKLRTAPLLFTSGAKITHNNPNLNENGSWIEGIYNISSGKEGYNSNRVSKTWPEITNTVFPYIIRNAADSFPCIVFYRDTSTQEQALTLLGQYVFMDDKKSDFVYGERSIYYNSSDPSDPFCMKIENKDADTKQNKVWDNGKVLLIEVVYPNSPLTSYTTKTVASSYQLDENDNLIPSGEQHRYDDTLTVDQQGNTTSYYWEQHFELIYPDKEDITDKNGNFSPSEFTETVTPFMDFLEWITDVASYNNTGSKLGATGSKARVTQAELDKFIAEAHDHLDLYKLAAYYIFFLRFGLIDSVERNAQLKTYDGQHWHYEPWDMDIALGCANNGVIAYEPPLTRDTIAGGTTYAFSGRTATQSNVLWDCLESWDYWAETIVPNVAQALYEAGLTYDNASKMFDEEYVGKWSETLYNESGHYKYIDATLNAKYRLYLNGARTSHRHWWLSKSMNYYDAKWSCGDFTKHSINFRIGKNSGVGSIKIYPTNNTFFKGAYGQKDDQQLFILGDGLVEATVESGATINATNGFDNKQYGFIFGASSIESLDMSEMLGGASNNIGQGYTDIDFKEAYDKVLGAQIKKLILGAPCISNSDNSKTIYTDPDDTSYHSNLSVGQNGIDAMTKDGNDVLENLEFLDVIGWYNKTDSAEATWLSLIFSGTGYDRKNINTLYAMGCDMATEFKTSTAGNRFIDLRLPSSVRTLEFNNSSWENISFWETTPIDATSSQYDKILGVPASVNSVKFKGSTAKNECSLDFILSWIDNIEAEIATAHPGYTSDELEAALWTELSHRVLYAEQINWGIGTTKLYYKDVIRLSKFANDGVQYNLKGYIVISDVAELTSTQLAELLNIFGEYVFSIGTINTNLVVDQNKGFVRISVNGESIYDQTLLDYVSTISIENGELYIHEPNRANLSATAFSLRSNLVVNAIVNDDMTYSLFENNHPANTYLWTLSANENDVSSLTKEYQSVKLEKRANGSIRIVTSEGDFSDYSFYINVYYMDGNTIKHDSVKINVVGVTYPTEYEFVFTRSNPRQVLYTLSIAADLFGHDYSLQVQLPEAYCLCSRNQQVEVSINTIGAHTATLKNILYYLTDLSNPQNNSGFIDKDDLCPPIPDHTLYNLVEDTNLGYTKDGNSGIVVQVIGNPPSTMKKYRLTARIFIGGKNPINKTLTFIVWDDNAVIVSQNTNNGLYNAIVALYNSNYSLNGWGRSIYKTDLLSLYGTLDFETYKTLTTSLMTELGDSVFLYTPYITAINLKDCTSISLVDITTQADQLNFSNVLNLQTLSVNGCTGLIGTIDLSSSPYLQSLDARNTSVGINITQGSMISTLQLGSPFYVHIERPKVLTSSGVTILSTSNIDDISLIGVNAGDSTQGISSTVHGYNIFNTLYA